MFLLFFLKKYEKFRNQIIQSVYSTPGISAPSSTSETTDEDILSSWKQIVDDRIKHVKQVNDLKHTIKSLEDELKSTREASNKLNQIRDLLVGLCSNETKWSLELKAKLDESSIDVKSTESIIAVLNVIREKFDSNLTQIQGLEARLVETSESGEKKLGDELEKKSQEFKSYLENVQTELNEKHQKELSDLRAEHETVVNSVKNEFTQQIEQLNSEIAVHLAHIETHSVEITTLKSDLASATEKEAILKELQEKFSLLSSDKEEIIQKYDLVVKDLESKLEASKSLELKLQSEITEYLSKISELKNLDESYQLKLGEATKNYKLEKFILI